ncbi:PfkB family carbohydrate kinase [Georgenia deserti]|uniref:PfkB family carbohydrate kinase n=1 Tax=Georgenia deserti TaxID=2093781 RepID=A0ABW4L753_9MICO
MATATAPDLVFVGALTLDAIALVESNPVPDSRQVALDVAHAGGGPAATAAVAAARLGARTAVVGTVGRDAEGERVLAELRAEGVDTGGIRVEPGRRTGASVILVDAAHGTRAIATRPVPEVVLDAAGAALVDRAAWVHVDHLGWRPVRDHLADSGAPARLSVDGGNPIDGFTAAGTDLYAPTVPALRERFGQHPVEHLLSLALEEGARSVVATLGSDGSVARDASGRHHWAAGHPVDVVSTLGAGDVFHGALLVATASGMPLQDALPYANVAAALSCRGLDGRSAVPTDPEVRAVLGAASATATRPAEEAR